MAQLKGLRYFFLSFSMLFAEENLGSVFPDGLAHYGSGERIGTVNIM